jgi:AraC-like DNA-binding protein
MSALAHELHSFIERLQTIIGLAQIDDAKATAQRLLMLEAAIPSPGTQPYSLMVRTVLVMLLLRFAQLCGPRAVAAVGDLSGRIYTAEDGGLRDAYRSAVLPIVNVLQNHANGDGARVGIEPRVNAALAQISRCATMPEALRLDDVARTCNVSKWHLERLLKRFTGLTFKEHVRMVRMAAARELLLSSNLTMKEIAARTGYLYETEFGRDFKAHFGITPTAWRRTELTFVRPSVSRARGGNA